MLLSAELLEEVRRAVPAGGDPLRMLPAEAYLSTDVLAWELRQLHAGSWVCLGRWGELLPRESADDRGPATQRQVRVGHVSCLLVRDGDQLRLFANTCRHRGHELLAEGESSTRRSIMCPYHAWTFDTAGHLLGAPGFRDVDGFEPSEHSLVELALVQWGGWAFGHALHAKGDPGVPSFEEHLGAMGPIAEPYHAERLVLADRHTYTVAANWKVIAENYHECYHCPLIHPELCEVTPPNSGDNYDLPGQWVGGAMVLREGMESMSSDGSMAATRLPDADPTRVEYLHLLPNLLISAHPDYVMSHRLVPVAPDRTSVECSWLVLPDRDGTVPQARGAVDFWDVTNQQDWAACESVQRGLASPHFRPGPFAPNEDAVAHLVSMIARAYLDDGRSREHQLPR